MNLSDTATLARALQHEMRRVIIGQERVIEEILTAFLAGGHCLLRGVPGLAKTLLIKTLAQAIDLRFNRIQFTPDLMPSDITGTDIIQEDASGKRQMVFSPGPIFANFVLADETHMVAVRHQLLCHFNVSSN